MHPVFLTKTWGILLGETSEFLSIAHRHKDNIVYNTPMWVYFSYNIKTLRCGRCKRRVSKLVCKKINVMIAAIKLAKLNITLK